MDDADHTKRVREVAVDTLLRLPKADGSVYTRAEAEDAVERFMRLERAKPHAARVFDLDAEWRALANRDREG